MATHFSPFSLSLLWPIVAQAAAFMAISQVYLWRVAEADSILSSSWCFLHAMDPRTHSTRMFNIVVFIFISVTTLIISTPCDARSSAQMLGIEGGEFGESSLIGGRKMQQVAVSLENSGSYISSPFSLPPFDSLSPLPSPETAPPFCVCPPFSPQPPSTPTTSPTFQGPPTHSPVPNPPEYELPSPPKHMPNPPKRAPGPPIFKPPVVLPPPSTPPPPHKAPQYAVWCVAKPTVPDPIIQEAMDYACGRGADCEAIKPNGLCFQPNTLFAHASYAFNSYWQRTKVAGGSCDFGGTAMLVTVNPSFDECHFVYN